MTHHTLTARKRAIKSIAIAHGNHASLESGACVMELVAFVAGEPWSDHPECASKVIGDFMRSWNDGMNDEDRQVLKPYIPKLVGTAGTPAQERVRSWMALDWYCRVSAPMWLRLAKLDAEAEAIEACAPITDSKSAKAAHKALSAASAKARAAWDAARDAAWAAAWDAARSAAGNAAEDAAWAAAGDAAGDAAGAAARSAAGDAAGDAARSAAGDAAGDAAWDAAWAAAWDAARSALRPTVESLQSSALELLDRMIAATA